MAITLRLLGTSAGLGVPAFCCDCSACHEARQEEKYARTRSLAAIAGLAETILLDAGPDVLRQLERAGIAVVDRVFLSHWHFDHYAGLGDLEFYMRMHRLAPVELYLPEDALPSFLDSFPHLSDVYTLSFWKFGQTYDLGGLHLTPLAAVHSVTTAGFLLEGERRVAYFTDTATLTAETAAKIAGVDVLVVDATFYQENLYPHSHMNLAEAVALGQKIKAGRLVLTHLGMHYPPVTVAELKAVAAAHGAELAFDGMEISL
jgi:phosphoribosyl 1,2-cyclic phosphate phosphodiesterase